MVVGEFTESTEVAILGAGPGGYVAAIRLAQLGKEVTLISSDPMPGGVCLNRGCIPSKALIEVANFYDRIQHADEMGILIKDPKVEYSKVKKFKQGVVDRLIKGVLQLIKQHKINFIQGMGSFLDAHTLQVKSEKGVQSIRFDQAIIATGSLSKPLPSFSIDQKKIMFSEDLLNISEIPESLAVLGGGYIGLEMGELFSKLGSKVTVIEAMDDILPGIDPFLLRPLKKKLTALSIKILTKTMAKEVKQERQKIKITIQTESNPLQKIQATHLLVAVGRIPHSKNIGLEKIPIKLDEKGFISVNDTQQTSLPHIYAIGDVCGGMMLAHKASREGIVAATHIAGKVDMMDNLVPAIIFTDPEIAYVGLSEEQAKNQGMEVATGMFSFAANGRALTFGEEAGFVKVLAEKTSKRILGVQMTGPHVSELISEATLGIEMGATIEDFALTIHPHPTLSEAVHEAMEGVLGMSIHRYQGKRN